MKKKLSLLVTTCIIFLALSFFFVRRSYVSRATRAKGIAAYTAGDYDTAVKVLDVYLKNNDDDVAWTVRGNAMNELGRLPEAEESYLAALRINGRNVRTLNAMGVLSRKSGDAKKAEEYYRKALSVNPQYAPTYLSLVTLDMERKRYKSALKNARRAYELVPDDPRAAAYLAVACHLNGLTAEREKYTRLARELGYSDMAKLDKIYSKR